MSETFSSFVKHVGASCSICIGFNCSSYKFVN